MKGFVASINISKKKGVSKVPVSGPVIVLPGLGIVGDAHAGTQGREVSLLPCEALAGVSYGGYGENIDTERIPIGTILNIGDEIRLVITQLGKVCPSRCSIFFQLGKCLMQQQGIFAKVLVGGEMKVGDEIRVEKIPK